ncbi:hypothetical protein [Burkholderia cenocepacia]|uniref:hypothetical protein n=1 Tax=Burkholderia cenocepacia TaxID=95486 RepID=UPI00158DBAD2|nr:hypothetical protein [Burkholderia cenocepacia]
MSIPLNSASPVEQHEAAPADALPIMRKAFRVTEVSGDPDPTKQRFAMRFSFPSIDALHAADDEWNKFVAAAQPEPPVADERAAALYDSAYCAGVQEGFRLGDTGDNEGLRKVLESRAGYVAVLREARASSPNAAGAEGARNVEGMTRDEFEHRLRIGFQHDNVRAHVNAPDFGLTADQEREIAERVALNYPTQTDCPGCTAFDSGASEVHFIQGCDGCKARMQKVAGFGPLVETPAQAAEDVRAWETDDGRVISDVQKQQALRDGGASASSVRPFHIALGKIAPAQASFDGNHVENHCPECGQYESECECAQADAREGLTDEQRESVEHAATWLARSEDLQNKAHAERLRALLAAHPGQPEPRDEVTDDQIAAMFERVTGYSLENGRAALNDADILGFARELLESARARGA